VLSEIINSAPGMRFSFEEIASMENIPIKEVVTIFDSALKKIREHVPEFFGEEFER
jgi:DNA-directed RNA polymerase specialized sigma24 family protein